MPMRESGMLDRENLRDRNEALTKVRSLAVEAAGIGD